MTASITTLDPSHQDTILRQQLTELRDRLNVQLAQPEITVDALIFAVMTQSLPVDATLCGDPHALCYGINATIGALGAAVKPMYGNDPHIQSLPPSVVGASYIHSVLQADMEQQDAAEDGAEAPANEALH